MKKIKLISLLNLLIFLTVCNGQIKPFNKEPSKSVDSLSTSKLFKMDTYYEIPKTDFTVFNLENKKGLYTGKINYSVLQQSAGFALCCMGRIPRINVTYYYKGYKSGHIQVGSVNFASHIKKVKLKSKRFKKLGDFEDKRNLISNKKNTYILEEETIGYNKALYVFISDVDSPNEGRLYSKLRDMTKKKYKGEATYYYFQGFETFKDKETFSSIVDYNGNGLLKLKFYFSDFPNDIEIDKVFTKKDSKNILGRDYVMKSYAYFKNKEYRLTWYEF